MQARGRWVGCSMSQGIIQAIRAGCTASQTGATAGDATGRLQGGWKRKGVVPPKGLEPSISWLRTRHVDRYTTGARTADRLPQSDRIRNLSAADSSAPRLYRVPLGFMNPQNKRGAPGPASELFPDACASGNSSSSGPLGLLEI